ncbi:hypothetical protein GcM3_044018 [Golovinomyces cichoracearum]|uniref:Uncharacterized protein n=1 Tax=Golovinomyces cichoracearum TaxID=62708 RepID=A0A420J1B6_9PEZI|nr:hypothetical protein GcM3_044018 [Golovinomyces cichoracearum]
MTASEEILMDEKGCKILNPEGNDIVPTKCDTRTPLQKNQIFLHGQNSRAFLRRSSKILNRE